MEIENDFFNKVEEMGLFTHNPQMLKDESFPLNLPDDLYHGVFKIVLYSFYNMRGVQIDDGVKTHVDGEFHYGNIMWEPIDIMECPEYNWETNMPCPLTHSCTRCGNFTTGHCCGICKKHEIYECSEDDCCDGDDSEKV